MLYLCSEVLFLIESDMNLFVFFSFSRVLKSFSKLVWPY